MPFSWELVTKNLERHSHLEGKVREKISKLEKHLQRFPPDAVHLKTHLEKNPRKPLYTASLTLHLPSNTLHADKSEPDPMPAFDEAVKALLREIETLKASLRHEDEWKDKERRQALHEQKAEVGFSETPQDKWQEEAQSLSDIVGEMFQQHYPRLVRYAWRRIWHGELLGELPRNALDPRGVVDEVARQVFLTAEQKPAELSYRLWFYQVLRNELHRRISRLQEQARQTVSVEDPHPAGEMAGQGFGWEGEEEPSMELIRERFEPERALIGEWLPDDQSWALDALIAQGDFLELMKSVSETWPEKERTVFELHFLEGFQPEEVAILEGITTKEVEELIPTVQQRLRKAVKEEFRR